jgi:hypothetical protein
MFQPENHFINKRIQKPRRLNTLNIKCIPAVNNVNKTNRNRYNSASSLAMGLGWVVKIIIIEIYDYEHFIPGGTNNLHFAYIRHPFLMTSR